MMRHMRWIGAIWIILCLVVGVWWAAHRRPADIGKIPLGQPGMTLMGTSLVGRENGEKIWEIQAKTIWLSKDGQIAVIKEIREAMVQVKDEKVTLGAAPWARLDRNLMKLTVKGGITGQIDDGRFTTEGLYIDLLSQKLYSTGIVNLSSSRFSVSAQRLEADLKKEILTLKGDVLLNEGEKVLRGRELIYYLEDKTYEVMGETEVELEL